MTNHSSPPLYLVDASGFIFRAYHALPPLTRPDGTPVGAVMGFCSILMKLIQQQPDARIFVIFDAARANYRNDIYPDYKANRDETPEDLIPQFPIIRDAARAFGLPVFEREGYEADDIIATYVTRARAENRQAVIVSSDKDLMQLIQNGITMFDPMKQITISDEQVFEKFGVRPDQVIDVQSLAGDSIDNVPGVPGIGIKTAAQLITEYGTLENLLDRAHEIKQPKRRESLIENRNAALISKQLVTLHTDVPDLPCINDVPPAHYDPDILRAFLTAQNFKSLLNRMGQVATTPTSVAATPTSMPAPTELKPAPENITARYECINTIDALQKFVTEAQTKEFIAVDTETTDLTPSKADLVGISLSHTIGHAVYIPIGHRGAHDLLGDSNDTIVQLPLSVVLQHLKPILENPAIIKVGQNLKYDAQLFLPHNISIAPYDDTMLMSYILDGAQHGHGLDELAKLHCGHDMISYDSVTGTGRGRISFADVPIDKAVNYAAEDADFTLRIYQHLLPRIARERMATMYYDIERPMVDMVARMEFAGIEVDPHMLKQLSQIFGTKIYELEQDIFKIVGHEFNVGSPKQLGQVLFEEMGLKGGAKTKTGDWSTAVDVLEQLAAEGHDIVQKILDWRHLSKLKSTYTEALQTAINPRTGRVHTSFSLAGTSTGRLSSSDPNLQNIPIRTDEGKEIRKSFVAKKDHVLISADYSQIELRLAAEMGNIAALKNAFTSGIDIHAATASQVFDIPLDQMTSDIRRKAKAINFGIIYGISAFGLGKQLDIETSEASAYIKQYFARFPELSDYMERTKEFARAHKYVLTHFGRKCFVGGIDDKNPARRNFAERQAINAPLQGTAADLMKLAMHAIDKRIRRDGLPLTMLLQVHDELIFEAPTDQAEALAKIIKEEMESVSPFEIPMIAETGIGLNWADAH
jgi:DNA polymerase-1